MRLTRSVLTVACVVLSFCNTAKAADSIQWRNPLRPCDGDCAIYVFAGSSVATNVQDIFFKPIGPTAWNYSGGSIVGGAVSRRIATVFTVFDIESELGTAKRFGDQTEGEFWGGVLRALHRVPVEQLHLHDARSIDRPELRHRHFTIRERSLRSQLAGRYAHSALFFAGADLRVAGTQRATTGVPLAPSFGHVWHHQRRAERLDLHYSRCSTLVLTISRPPEKSCRWWRRGHRACRPNLSNHLPMSPRGGRDG